MGLGATSRPKSVTHVQWNQCWMIDILVNDRLMTSDDIMHGISVASLPLFVFGSTKLLTRHTRQLGNVLERTQNMIKLSKKASVVARIYS